jgi:hypothetical protein
MILTSSGPRHGSQKTRGLGIYTIHMFSVAAVDQKGVHEQQSATRAPTIAAHSSSRRGTSFVHAEGVGVRGVAA